MTGENGHDQHAGYRHQHDTTSTTPDSMSTPAMKEVSYTVVVRGPALKGQWGRHQRRADAEARAAGLRERGYNATVAAVSNDPPSRPARAPVARAQAGAAKRLPAL